MNPFPILSVILPVYNCEKYIFDSISSILNQTYSNFELIIINDFSSDESEKIILNFKDNRIRYFKNEKNLKLIATLNLGLTLSKGHYIARMDADDISYPERFESQIQFLETRKDIDLIGTAFKLIDHTTHNNGRFNGITEIKYPKNSCEIAFELIYNNVILHPSVMFRKEIFNEQNNLYDPEYLHAEEYHLWTKLILTHNLGNLDVCLFEYRVHESQISSNFSLFQQDKCLQIQNNYLANLGFNFNLKETKLFVAFLQGESIQDEDIRILLNLINDFLDKLSKISIIDTNYALRYIKKKIKNLIINCKRYRFIDLFKYNFVLTVFFSLSIKQKIAFLIKQKIA